MPHPVLDRRGPESTPNDDTRARARTTGRAPRVCAWLAALVVGLTPALGHAHEIVHVVAKGQTLGRIAKRYRVSVDAIREANSLSPGQRLHPGQSLVIPEKGKEAEAAKRAAQLKEKDGKPEKGKKGKAEKPEKGKKKGKKDEADDKADAGWSKEGWAKGPKRRGWVRMMRGTDRFEGQLIGKRGHLTPAALAGLSKMLRFGPTGEKTAIDPRLVALVAAVSDHFGGRPIHVVSGYRPYTPAQYTPHSNHNLGRAMDFSVEGIPNTVVRDFCRTFRNAGVGYYPNSTFVHLDVRAGKAYWVDYSRPGEAPHYDSPNAKNSADEAVGDVEPHAGAGGSVDDANPGSKPPADEKPGSPDTQ
jgi:uncharacterized protein YcbK (DUF882 family)/LysM repeat protein